VAIRAKEALIAAARSSGANTRELSALTGLNTSNISRRYDSATRRIQEDDKFRKLVDKIGRTYRQTR
jgi:hypothetical protein